MLWGSSYLWLKVGVQTIPPLTLIAGRTLIAGGLLYLYVRQQGLRMPPLLSVNAHSARIVNPVWWQFAIQALLNCVVPFLLIAWAMQTVPAGVATILNSTSPVFVFLATWLITRHEAVSVQKLIGVAAGISGICLIVGPTALAGLGDQLVPQLAIVFATLCYAAAVLYGRAFHGLPPAMPAAGSMIVGAILLCPVSLLLDAPWALRPSWASLGALLMLSVFSTALAFAIYFRLLKTLGSVGVTAQAYLRVPVGVGLSLFVLGESLAPTAWMGLVLAIVGVVAMVWQRK